VHCSRNGVERILSTPFFFAVAWAASELPYPKLIDEKQQTSFSR